MEFIVNPSNLLDEKHNCCAANLGSPVFACGANFGTAVGVTACGANYGIVEACNAFACGIDN